MGRMILTRNDAIHSLLCLLVLSACENLPPLSFTAGFMGAQVTVATPGWTKEVAVERSKIIDAPVLMVPPGTMRVTSQTIAEVTDAKGDQSTVPVIEAPVSVPVLIEPK